MRREQAAYQMLGPTFHKDFGGFRRVLRVFVSEVDESVINERLHIIPFFM